MRFLTPPPASHGGYPVQPRGAITNSVKWGLYTFPPTPSPMVSTQRCPDGAITNLVKWGFYPQPPMVGTQRSPDGAITNLVKCFYPPPRPPPMVGTQCSPDGAIVNLVKWSFYPPPPMVGTWCSPDGAIINLVKWSLYPLPPHGGYLVLPWWCTKINPVKWSFLSPTPTPMVGTRCSPDGAIIIRLNEVFTPTPRSPHRCPWRSPTPHPSPHDGYPVHPWWCNHKSGFNPLPPHSPHRCPWCTPIPNPHPDPIGVQVCPEPTAKFSRQ